MTHYLISILVSVGILVFYAIILILVDEYIGNYGICKITLNNEKELNVDGGRTLLNSLIENKIFIPSACGGKGTCGYCKCKVTDGAGPILPTEVTVLTKQDIKAHKRLSCQIKVKGDLKVEIPADMLYAKEYKTTISKIEDLTYDIKLIEFKLPTNEFVDFKPGQYMQFKIPGTEEFRAYSIASTPKEKGIIQFMIRKVPEGLCSGYIHDSLEVGDKVILTGPYGDFFLQENSTKDVICVAGGVGVPPLRSIIQHLFDKGTNRQVYYFFGARSVKDLYYYDQPSELAKQYPNFKYIPALSEPGAEDNWTGETGFIHLAIDKVIQNNNAEVYLCGPEPMINAATNVLKAKGIQDEDIYYDKF